MWQTQTDSCAFGHICEYKQTFKQESVKGTLIHIELQEQSHIYVQMQCCFIDICGAVAVNLARIKDVTLILSQPCCWHDGF